MSFLNKYFDEDGQLVLDLNNTTLSQMNSLLDNIADIKVCQHVDRVHRARFMCHSCYHERGNMVKAWTCGHFNRPHHSNGICKKCYHHQYYTQRKCTQENKDGKIVVSVDTKSKSIKK